MTVKPVKHFHIRLLHLCPVLGLKRAYSRAGSQKDKRTDVEWGRPRTNAAHETELKRYQFETDEPPAVTVLATCRRTRHPHHRAKHPRAQDVEKPVEGPAGGGGAESPKQPRPTG